MTKDLRSNNVDKEELAKKLLNDEKQRQIAKKDKG